MYLEQNSDFSHLLKQWKDGDSAACDKIFPSVYSELHRIAHQQLFKAWGVDTMNTTALVNETYLKLVNQSDAKWEDKAHFLAVSATAMRQILINYAERKHAHKRGGQWQQVTLDESFSAELTTNDNLLLMEAVLKVLAQYDARLGKLVEMRFFGGMTESEIGCVLGVTDRTVRRDWKKSKALLSQIIKDMDNDKARALESS